MRQSLQGTRLYTDLFSSTAVPVVRSWCKPALCITVHAAPGAAIVIFVAVFFFDRVVFIALSSLVYCYICIHSGSALPVQSSSAPPPTEHPV